MLCLTKRTLKNGVIQLERIEPHRYQANVTYILYYVCMYLSILWVVNGDLRQLLLAMLKEKFNWKIKFY